ncbi:degenerin-like protein unc-105 [Caerostris extrusa]|uniref:Degenerin-like protein unc-105 n=1 Tax=Caerostris extrusa TaxID=172846 RepID=A0AAV4R7M4_CAEEX|nr:degenerin-like protein unc-105 [Caerostris extrusa]
MPSTKNFMNTELLLDSLVAACSFEGMHCHRESATSASSHRPQSSPPPQARDRSSDCGPRSPNPTLRLGIWRQCETQRYDGRGTLLVHEAEVGEPWGSCEKETRRLYNGDPYTLLGCEKYCGYKAHDNAVQLYKEAFHARECAYRVSQNIERLEECGCRPPCKEAIYSYTVTASELNENYYRTVKAIRTLSLDSAGKKRNT